MNRSFVLFHLKEAQEELDRTIREIEDDPNYEHGEFVVAMSHLYHHANTAWNARNASKQATDDCSEEDFARWRKMPPDSDLLLEG
jgi:hypothetical protein